MDKQLLLQCLNLLEDADESADMLCYFRPRRPQSIRRKLGTIVARWAMWAVGCVVGGRGLGHAQRGFFLTESFSQSAM